MHNFCILETLRHLYRAALSLGKVPHVLTLKAGIFLVPIYDTTKAGFRLKKKDTRPDRRSLIPIASSTYGENVSITSMARWQI